MARDLSCSDNNDFTLLDPVSGDKIIFYYRTPQSTDRVRHMSRKFGRKGNVVVSRNRSACIESALDVLVGIRDGDFTIGKDGEGNAIGLSSTPETPGYREDWKTLIEQMAGDLLFYLGFDLFEQKISADALKDVRVVSEEDVAEGIERDDQDAETETPPLPKSSGD